MRIHESNVVSLEPRSERVSSAAFGNRHQLVFVDEIHMILKHRLQSIALCRASLTPCRLEVNNIGKHIVKSTEIVPISALHERQQEPADFI